MLITLWICRVVAAAATFFAPRLPGAPEVLIAVMTETSALPWKLRSICCKSECVFISAMGGRARDCMQFVAFKLYTAMLQCKPDLKVSYSSSYRNRLEASIRLPDHHRPVS